MDLHVATYNIHKGFSTFQRRMVIHELREHLHRVAADIFFLQEVQGAHTRHAERWRDWPAEPQHVFLADALGQQHAYGRNAVYAHGHHGNAILSRLPIVMTENEDVSSYSFEQRGLLHCAIALPEGLPTLHCLCVHLALTEHGRQQQIGALVARIQRHVPPTAPLIVAGDFNDWRNRSERRLARELGLSEAFRDRRGRPARSFPSSLPLLRLDRIYTRGFAVMHAEVHHGDSWARISDHALLSAHLALD